MEDQTEFKGSTNVMPANEGKHITEYDTTGDVDPGLTVQRKPWKLCNWNRSDPSIDPYTYSTLKKNLILVTIALAGSISPISSTLYIPALVQMQSMFDTTDTIMNLSLSIYTFLVAICPVFWASFGDRYGRRNIYLISLFISILGSIGCALSVNIAMFIAFRAISAAGGSSVLAMGAGTLADIFEPHKRGRAMALYTCGPLLGPSVGPVLGGFLNESFGWRASFWFIVIFNSIIWLAILFILPETWRASPGSNDSKESKSGFLRAFSALQLIRIPNITLVVLFLSLVYMILYVVIASLTRVYTLQYHMNSAMVGLCYLPMAIGAMVGATVGGFTADRTLSRQVAEANGQSRPEMRLNSAMICLAIFIQVCALIAYGWCIQLNLHFAFGLAALFSNSLGVLIVNVTLSTYVIDCCRSRPASGAACLNLARYFTGAIGSLSSPALLKALNNGILFTVFGSSVLVASSLVFCVKFKSRKWEQLRTKDAECRTCI